MAERDEAFLGRGWAWPLALDAQGEIALDGGAENIAQSVRLILETNLGERVMRPEFGSGLRAAIFENIDATTLALTRHHIERALTQWEPRIDQLSIVTEARPSLGRIDVELRYRVRETNVFYNLVYPFYVREAG
jgi:uncharacterized protein